MQPHMWKRCRVTVLVFPSEEFYVRGVDSDRSDADDTAVRAIRDAQLTLGTTPGPESK
jgi:hypothetical protein